MRSTRRSRSFVEDAGGATRPAAQRMAPSSAGMHDVMTARYQGAVRQRRRGSVYEGHVQEKLAPRAWPARVVRLRETRRRKEGASTVATKRRWPEGGPNAARMQSERAQRDAQNGWPASLAKPRSLAHSASRTGRVWRTSAAGSLRASVGIEPSRLRRQDHVARLPDRAGRQAAFEMVFFLSLAGRVQRAPRCSLFARPSWPAWPVLLHCCRLRAATTPEAAEARPRVALVVHPSSGVRRSVASR